LTRMIIFDNLKSWEGHCELSIQELLMLSPT